MKASISCDGHDDVIKCKHGPRYWPFVQGIHRSPVNSPHKGQWRGPLMFSLICAWIDDWVNNGEVCELIHYHAHYDIVMCRLSLLMMTLWQTFLITGPLWGESIGGWWEASVFSLFLVWISSGQTIEFPVICDAMTHMWYHDNVFINTRFDGYQTCWASICQESGPLFESGNWYIDSRCKPETIVRPP